MKNSALQKNIRTGLALKNISVSELERRCSLKQSTIQNILLGRSKNPSIATLQAMAHQLGCTLEQLISEDNADHSDFTNAIYNKSKTSKTVLWKYDLYIQAAAVTQKAFDNKELQLSAEQALKCIQEVYYYSLLDGKVNENFATWLIERYYSLE